MKKPIRQDQLPQSEDALYEAVLALRDVAECRAFFHDLCTPAERQAMADRWRVIPLIQAGVPYREIHERTGVSVTTIGRVARCFQQGEGGYRQVFERTHGARHPDRHPD